MSIIYYIGQGCAILAWILLLISYHAKRENRVIFYQIMSSILYILNYFCIGALTGFWISIFELIKSIGYYKTDKDKYIFLYTLPVYLIIAIFTGFNIITLFAILGSLIDGFVLLKSKKTMVVGGMISYTLWIVYDLYFLDYAGALSDLFVVISNLTILIKGLSTYIRKSDIYTVKSLKISNNTIKLIEKLDKRNLDKEYRWDEQTIKELTQNHEYSYILIKDKNKIIGYVNFLNLKEDIYNKMINSDTIYDTFNKEDIIDFTKNRKLYINLNAIILNDEYINSDTLYKIEESIKRYIKKLTKERYYINKICCFSVNHLEVKVLEELEFNKIKDITNECFLYEKEI